VPTLPPLLRRKFFGRRRASFFDAGDKQSAAKLIEFVFAREYRNHQLVPQLLGARGDSPCVSRHARRARTLRRLARPSWQSLRKSRSRAALLEKTGHNAEAVEFLDQLVKSAPWKVLTACASRRPGWAAKDANSSTDGLAKIASNAEAPYNIRVEAATALSGAQTGAGLGSAS